MGLYNLTIKLKSGEKAGITFKGIQTIKRRAAIRRVLSPRILNLRKRRGNPTPNKRNNPRRNKTVRRKNNPRPKRKKRRTRARAGLFGQPGFSLF